MAEEDSATPGVEQTRLGTLDERVTDIEHGITLKNGIAVGLKQIDKGGTSRGLVGTWGNFYALVAEWIVQGEEDPALLGLTGIPYQRPPKDDPAWLPKPIVDPMVRNDVYAAAQESWRLFQEAKARPNAAAAVQQYMDFMKTARLGDVARKPLVFVKVLVPPTESDEESRMAEITLKKFINEYYTIRRLQHRGIIESYGLVNDRRLGWCQLLEYITGSSLHAFMVGDGKGTRRLAPDVALPLFSLIAKSVKYCHDNHVIHGDIKPQNILLRPIEKELEKGIETLPAEYHDAVEIAPGQYVFPVICDFGISKVIDPGQAQTQLIMGSVYHMAPETARGEARTPASDVYSLGATLFQMLTGRYRYMESDHTKVISMLQKTELDHPTALKEEVPGISSRISDLVEIACRKDPDKRWTMDQLIAEADEIVLKRFYAQQADLPQTSTQLRRIKKVLDWRTHEIDTKIEFIGLEEAIRECRGMIAHDDYAAFGRKASEISLVLPDKPLRFDRLKQEMCQLLIDVGENRYTAGQHVHVGDALGNAEKLLAQLPADANEDYLKLHTAYRHLLEKFAEHEPFVNSYRNVLSQLDQAKETLGEIYGVRAAGKPFADKLGLLERRLRGAKAVWAPIKPEHLGEPYQALVGRFREFDEAILDLKRETTVKKPSA